MPKEKIALQRKNKSEYTHIEIRRIVDEQLVILKNENDLSSRSQVIKRLIDNNKGKKL